MGYLTSKTWGNRHLGGKAGGLLVIMLFTWFVALPLVEKCSKMPGTATLQAGQRIMFQMAGRKNLRQVEFFETYPRARPSDFVNMISDPNHKLWPPPPREDATRGVGMGSSPGNRILMPTGLVFSPRERRQREVDELVFVPDDTNLKLILRGYVAGQDEMAFEYVWDFPTNAGKVKL